MYFFNILFYYGHLYFPKFFLIVSTINVRLTKTSWEWSSSSIFFLPKITLSIKWPQPHLHIVVTLCLKKIAPIRTKWALCQKVPHCVPNQWCYLPFCPFHHQIWFYPLKWRSRNPALFSLLLSLSLSLLFYMSLSLSHLWIILGNREILKIGLS